MMKKKLPVVVEEEDKLIARTFKIPIIQNENSITLFHSEFGTETIYPNKTHSVVGNIFYQIEINNEVEFKHIIFLDSILNLICLIRSKKIKVTSNMVFIVVNNPVTELYYEIKNKFKLIFKISFVFPKTLQGKIQTIKTILYMSDFTNVNVSLENVNIIIKFADKCKSINTNVSFQRIIRDFNFSSLKFNLIPLGYNVFNLKFLYGYKD